ncbi:MAG: 3-dehydroquinate synthase [Clostridiales bacterium]|nr:3-dehydroquinate synthase [Clostridiales bacterium]
MEKIEVKLADRPYDVIVKRGLLAEEGPEGGAARIIELAAGNRIAFVSDENVWNAGGSVFFEALKSAAGGGDAGAYQEPFSVLVPPGEKNKNFQEFGRLLDAFAEAGLDRDGLVVSMGGGVVGNLAGFAAAAWMRGVRYVQVPTTLLAMVDSSVGGKTGVNIPAGKNLIGAFHQPALVLADPDCLLTLPVRELRSGMAEVIKYGAIESESLFERLEGIKTGAGVPMAMFSTVIADCIGIKAEIVAKDELEREKRAILNFGHTFGHAIDAKHGFDKYTHGEAVAMGMLIAARYGEAIGVTEPGTAERLSGLLGMWGLDKEEQTDGLVELIRRDKRSKGDAVKLVLLKHIGSAGIFRTQLSSLAAGLEALDA